MAEELKTNEITPDESLELAPIKQVPGMQTMWNNVKMMNQAYRTARMLSEAGFVPDSYKNSPGNCLIAMDLANRMGISPMTVMQNLYMVKGRPAWSGSFCAAAVSGSGRFTPLEYQWVGERGKPSFGCRAVAKRLSDGSACYGTTVTMQMAQDEGWLQKPGSKWRTMPEQMLQYRAASFFAKVHCSDYLMGVNTIEEVQDISGGGDGGAVVVTL